jgi:hypothetical protein
VRESDWPKKRVVARTATTAPTTIAMITTANMVLLSPSFPP